MVSTPAVTRCGLPFPSPCHGRRPSRKSGRDRRPGRFCFRDRRSLHTRWNASGPSRIRSASTSRGGVVHHLRAVISLLDDALRVLDPGRYTAPETLAALTVPIRAA